jgi:hypothetical protein
MKNKIGYYVSYKARNVLHGMLLKQSSSAMEWFIILHSLDHPHNSVLAAFMSGLALKTIL